METAMIRKINGAEGIFLPCFDMTLTCLDEFYAEHCSLEQAWDNVKIESTEKEFSLTWNGIIHTEAYNTLIFFMTVPDYMTVSADARVNGIKTELFNGVPGSSEGPVELSGKVQANAVVEKITLRFCVHKNDLTNYIVNLSWVGLQCFEKVQELTKPSFYDKNSWDSYINYNASPDCRDNVLFSEEEIRKILKNLNEPIFKGIADAIYKEAQKHEALEPEKQIGTYLPVSKGLYRYTRVRDRNRIVLHDKMLALAVAGFLFNERKWSHLAARILMSIVKTPHWFEGPQCHLEGSAWHHVCFTEQAVVQAIFFSLGFLGGMFSQKAIDEMKEAVLKHYKTIIKCCKEQGYRKFSNQGIVESAGRMVGACGLYQLGMKECIHEIEDCYNEHCSLIANYINEEGHCSEGPAYYQYSMTESAYLWKAYSKHMNVSIDKVIPKAVVNSLTYIDCVTSTSSLFGKVVSLNNTSGTKVSDVFLALFASVYPWHNGKSIVKNRIENNNSLLENANPISNLMLMNYYGNSAAIEPEQNEKWYIFEKSGLGCYENKTSKFWFCAERNPRTGHYHNDRGSVILEHNGNILLADPGVTSYSNWMSSYMKKQEYHNLAHPEKIPMKVQSDIAAISANEAGIGCRTIVSSDDFLHPAAHIHYINKIENGISFSANSEELYEGVSLAKREGFFRKTEQGAELELSDQWETAEAMPLWINFLSYGKWKIDEKTASVCVGSSQLQLFFDGKEEFKLYAEETIVDYALRPVYILRLKTDKGSKHKIFTKGAVM